MGKKGRDPSVSSAVKPLRNTSNQKGRGKGDGISSVETSRSGGGTRNRLQFGRRSESVEVGTGHV